MAGNGRRHCDREQHYRHAAVLHPLRQRILRLLSDDREARLVEIATDLGESRAKTAHHVRILVNRGALRIVPQPETVPALYRWASDAEWARKMLDEIDARSGEDE